MALTQEQRQDIFNKAVAGLASQGWQQALDDGRCLYRAPDGKKCAIGHVVSDEAWTKESCVELSAASTVLRAAGYPVSARDYTFSAHDCGGAVTTADKIKGRFRVFADKFSLTHPPELA